MRGVRVININAKNYSGLPQRLRFLRGQKKISQYELADAVGISRGVVGNYEVGARQPDYQTLCLFADYYEVSTDYLLGQTDIPVRLTSPGSINAIAGLIAKLEGLTYGELSALESSLENRELITLLEGLSPQSMADIKSYAALLRLRDEAETWKR